MKELMGDEIEAATALLLPGFPFLCLVQADDEQEEEEEEESHEEDASAKLQAKDKAAKLKAKTMWQLSFKESALDKTARGPPAGPKDLSGGGFEGQKAWLRRGARVKRSC